MTMTRAGRRPYETIQPATIGRLRLLRVRGALETHIRRLRRKLGSPPAEPLIRTVRGSGYIFDVDADQLTGLR